MLQAVVVTNFFLSLVCLFVAWKIWQLRRTLAQVADTLLSVERNTHNILYGAPKAISQGQVGTAQLRKHYQQLEPQLQRARQSLALLSLGLGLWQRRSRTQFARKPTRRR